MTQFYTYLWLREDGTPYYVGKGKKYRAFDYWTHGSLACPPKERILIQEFQSEEEAFEAERFLILFYGRKDIGTGILRNLTDGGEGASGCVQSAETIAKRVQQVLGRKNTEITLDRMRRSAQERGISSEQHHKMIDAKNKKFVPIMCGVEGCGKAQKCKALCMNHYMRSRYVPSATPVGRPRNANTKRSYCR